REVLDLPAAEEEQVLGLKGRVLLRFLQLDADSLERRRSQFRCSLLELRSLVNDLFGQQVDNALGARAELGFIQVGLESFSSSALPRLAGDPRATHPTVDRRFRAARVVPVEVAGRDGLQDVDVDQGAVLVLTHW